ncbi:MAG: CPBP family intramembrane metalloprotease [Actinomycetota bacterium]|nr:CPBP family intramembrane metalloprotease [Actinomycetota bacterium]
MSAYVPPRPDGPYVEQAPAKATWRWWEVTALTLAGFVLGAVASTPLFLALGGQPDGLMDGPGAAAAACTYLVVAATLLLWLRVAHKGWWRVVGWPAAGERVREAAVGVGLGIVSQVGVTVFAALAAFILAALAGTGVEVPPQVRSLTGWEAAALVVYAVVVAPPVEELIFRGLLFHSVADRHGFWSGAAASAIPFGFIHLIPGAALGVGVLVFTMMITGVAWAWIHRRRQNLLVNIAIHATFNAVGVLVTLQLRV